MTGSSISTTTFPKASDFKPADQFNAGEPGPRVADNRSGNVYVFTERVRIAIRVALATGRPLLVRGPSGWGKSSLAAAAARYLGWKLRDVVVTSRTQARDLLWSVDMLKRLSDAQTQKLDPDWRRYVRPGVLWWAFNPKSAREQEAFFASDAPPSLDAAELQGTVVLVDEIDKADPDVPNNLLVPLGSLQFDVEEVANLSVKAEGERIPLVLITTNEERALPNAFLRRCIQLELPAFDTAPDPKAPQDKEAQRTADEALRRAMLVDVAALHLAGEVTRKYIERIAEVLLVPDAPLPSPAEFLDTVRAAHELLEATPKADPLKEIASLVSRSIGT